MFLYKKCGSERAVKNGMVAGKRYRCKECGCNYREGDKRTNEKVAAKLSVLLLSPSTSPHIHGQEISA
jgi:transposase-like protein